jgi:Mlc titration factor MtfA (ptsG expression regulator)
MFSYLKNKKRQKLRDEATPAEWPVWIDNNFAMWKHIPEDDRREILSHINVFLNEKSFEGCNGLEITDEIKVTIAAQACLFLLHRKHDYYPSLHSILVYPEPFLTATEEVDEAGVVTEVVKDQAGQTWERGSLVLAWDEVIEGGRDLEDGFNVVLHEFAHQLDLENGEIDGVPRLEGKGQYKRWIDIFSNAYETFCNDIDRGKATFLDPYGDEHPSEFFAVAVESFFEEPRDFQRAHPDLYDVMKDYFSQDPAAWPVS